MRKVRRIARELGADGCVTGSRVRRLLKELVEILRLYAADREKRRHVFDTIGNQRKTLASIDIYLQIHIRSARFLSMKLPECLLHRMPHLYAPVSRAQVLHILRNEGNESIGKDTRRDSQAVCCIVQLYLA